MLSLPCTCTHPCPRKLAELEAQLIEEETAARVSEAVEARVAEALASEAVQQSLQQRLEEERRHIEQAVGCAGGACSGELWGLVGGVEAEGERQLLA